MRQDDSHEELNCSLADEPTHGCRFSKSILLLFFYSIQGTIMRACDSLPNVAIRLFDTNNSIRFIRMTYGHSYFKIDLSSIWESVHTRLDRSQTDFH